MFHHYVTLKFDYLEKLEGFSWKNKYFTFIHLVT